MAILISLLYFNEITLSASSSQELLPFSYFKENFIHFNIICFLKPSLVPAPPFPTLQKEKWDYKLTEKFCYSLGLLEISTSVLQAIFSHPRFSQSLMVILNWVTTCLLILPSPYFSIVLSHISLPSTTLGLCFTSLQSYKTTSTVSQEILWIIQNVYNTKITNSKISFSKHTLTATHLPQFLCYSGICSRKSNSFSQKLSIANGLIPSVMRMPTLPLKISI